MKKILLIALCVVSAGMLSAQDMELTQVLEPDASMPLNNTDTITVRFTMVNNGPGDLNAGETYSGQIRFGTGNPITLNGQPLGSVWPAGQSRTVTLLNNYALAGTPNGGWEICAWINNTSQYGADPTPANDTACATFTVQDPPPPASLADISAVAEGFNYGNGVLSYNFVMRPDSTKTFSLMNLAGQVVWKRQVGNNLGTIELDVDSPGLYLLMMEEGSSVETKKVFVD